MVEKKKQKEKSLQNKEKKVHPFLFLCILFFLGFIVVYLWLDWVQKSEAKRIKEIVQSSDIAMLLTGKEFSKKEFSQELEEIKKAHTPDRSIKNSNLANVVQSFTKIPDFTEECIGLAMKEIQISQGENGLEEWTLKANWATMREESNIVQFEKPEMWHRVKDKNNTQQSQKDNNKYLKNVKDKLIVTAERGLVYDNNEKVLLQENVKAIQAKNSIKGDVLSYDSKEQIAIFPNKATFKGESLEGSANVMSWNMQENNIYGSGRVQVLWTPNETNTKKQKIKKK